MKKIFIIILGAILTGCTAMSPPPEQYQSPSWPQLNHLRSWAINGSIGIRTPTDGVSASLFWQQMNDRYQLHLFGPFGVGHIVMEGTPHQITLQTADQRVFHAESPEQLLQNQLGWSLPMSNLIYWIRGLPAPDYPAQYKWDPYHRLSQLKQQGWQIDYSNYKVINQFVLPSQLTLTYPQLRIRLVIKKWNLQ